MHWGDVHTDFCLALDAGLIKLMREHDTSSKRFYLILFRYLHGSARQYITLLSF